MGRLRQALVPFFHFVALLLAVGLAAGAITPAAVGELFGNTFVVHNTRVFDGVQIIERGSVLVVDGRIAAVGQLSAPSDTPVYDGHGKTLLPGLIDAHVHTDEQARRDALRFGVTTELDMFGDPEVLAEAKRQRQSLERTNQADLWSAGIGVTVPGGHPNLPGWEYPRLTSDADPDRFVTDRIREGSDYLKFIVDDGGTPPLPTLTPDQVWAVIAAAHRQGRMTVGHAEALRHARTAVDAGTDGLVHVFVDTAADDAFVGAIRQRGSFVVATLSVFDCGAGADELLIDPQVSPYLSAAQIASLRSRNPRCQPSLHRVGTANVGRLHAAGVPILAGTDAGLPGTAAGASMSAELSHLVRAGLPPTQALTAATAAPARYFGLTDRGRVAPGLRADLILVNGDPTKDITMIRDIAVIWKNGYQVERRP